MQISSVPFLDNAIRLPDSIFNKPTQEVWITCFFQDVVGHPETNQLITCQAGLAMTSRWDVMGGQAAEKVARVLNGHFKHVWLMAEEDYADRQANFEGEASSAWFNMRRALKKNPNNILFLKDPAKKTEFPGHYDAKAPFDPRKTTDFFAVGLTPHNDVTMEHLIDITGRHRNDPRVVLMDREPNGPVRCVAQFRPLQLLAANGTDAETQNPPFVIIEAKFSEELVTLLMKKFRGSRRLVLRYVFFVFGEGAVTLNASTVESLRKDLFRYLSTESEFQRKNPASVCLVESFSTAPGDHNSEKVDDTTTRIMYVVLQNQGKINVYPVAGVRASGGSEFKTDAQSHVFIRFKESKDGKFELNAEQLEAIRKRHFDKIAAFAKRAVSYNPDAAVEFFLSSSNHLFNLVGIELFSPMLSRNYREVVYSPEGTLYHRVSKSQIKQLIALIQNNKQPIIRERIWVNIIEPTFELLTQIPFYEAAEGLVDLVELLVKESNDPTWRHFCEQALINCLISLYPGWSNFPTTFALQEKSIFLLKQIAEDRLKSSFLLDRTRLVVRFASLKQSAGRDYAKAISRLKIRRIPKKVIQLFISICKPSQNPAAAFELYRWLMRFDIEATYFKQTWRQSDWERLLQIWDESVELLPIVLLPEAIHLGWKPDQLITLIKTFFKKSPDTPLITCFIGLVRTIGHHRNVDSNLAYQFIRWVIATKNSPEDLVRITRKILDETLIQGHNITVVLINLMAINGVGIQLI